MSELILKAIPREKLGTAGANTMRRQGQIPAVVYSHGEPSKHIAVYQKEFMTGIGYQWEGFGLLKIMVDGESEAIETVVKKVQVSKVKRNIIHIDFYKITRGEQIEVDVPIKFLNEDTFAGAKEGGTLDIMSAHVAIRCLPANLPKFITVDVKDLKVGKTMYMSHLNVPDEVKVLDQMNKPVVHCSGKMKAESVAVSAVAEAPEAE